MLGTANERHMKAMGTTAGAPCQPHDHISAITGDVSLCGIIPDGPVIKEGYPYTENQAPKLSLDA